VTVPNLSQLPVAFQRNNTRPWRWLLAGAVLITALAFILLGWPDGLDDRAWIGWSLYLVLFVGLSLLSYRLSGELLFRFHSVSVVAAFLAFGLPPALLLILVGAAAAETARFGIARVRGVAWSGRQAVWQATRDAAVLSAAMFIAGAFYAAVGGKTLGAVLHLAEVPALVVLFVAYQLARAGARVLEYLDGARAQPFDRERQHVLRTVTAELMLPLMVLVLTMAFTSYPNWAWLVVVTVALLGGGVLFRALIDSQANLQKRVAEAQSLANDLALINNTSNLVNASLDLSTVMRRICQVAVQIGGQQAAIILRTEDDQQFHLVESTHLEPALVKLLTRLLAESPYPAEDTFAALNAQAYTDLQADWLRTLAQQGGFSAVICRPLPSLRHLQDEVTLSPNGQQTLLGFLILFYSPPHTPRDRELRLFDILANQATVAIENAHLYQETQNAVRRLTHLTDSTRIFNSSLALDMVDELVVEWLVNTLSVASASLGLWNREQNALVLQAYARNPEAPLGAVPPVYIQPLDEAPEVQWVLRNRWSRLIDTTDDDLSPALRLWLEQGHLHGIMLTPLVVRNEAIGLLILGLSAERPLLPADIVLIEAVAGQAATAVQNAQLYSLTEAALAARLTELSALEDTLSALSASLDPDAVVDQVLEAAWIATNADLVACGLLTPIGTLKTAWRLKGSPEVQRGEALAERSGVIQRVLKTGQPALIPDVGQEADYMPPTNTDLPFESELCVPILHEGKPLGVLNLESSTPRAFNAHQLRFLESLASHAAIAIERARLYDAVRSGRDQTQAILNTVRDGLMLVDRTGRLLQINPAAGRLLQIDTRPFLGQPVVRLFSALEAAIGRQPEVSRAKIKTLIRTLRDPSHQVIKDEIKLALAGQYRYIEVMSAPVLGETGNPIGRLLVFHDVTSERALEQARNELTNMILHDLRSPLNSIMGSIDMVHELSRDPADAPLLAEVLEIAQSSVENLLNLVESMLDVARLEENQMPLQLSALPVTGPLDEALRSMDVLAQGGQVTLVADAPGDLPLVRMDSDKIRRVIVNLVDNALRFTPAGGRVLVRAEYPPAGDALLISVIDNGPGVPPEARERIFEKFATDITGPSETRRRGIGLGLTFCRLAVEAHGGHIWVENAPPPDRGAAFRFTLPLAKEKSMMQAGTVSGQARLGDAPLTAAPSTDQDAPQGQRADAG